MTEIALSLVSHTNVGKTTLARTLLGRDIGEVRDAPHVTEFADAHPLVRTEGGDVLTLWDTPGFGDSVRLARRLRGASNPIVRFLTETWDRWRDRPFWASQQVMRHVQERSDLLLYLVNAAEPPAGAGYVAAEMELLDWVGKPVLVLLNQLGPPKGEAAEAADVKRWSDHLERWPLVKAVLPLDAFARCWVQEAALWRAVEAALPPAQQPVMHGLRAAWGAERERVFEGSMAALAESLARAQAHREVIDDSAGGLRDALRQLGSALGVSEKAGAALKAAQARLAAALDAELRRSTDALLRLHGLSGQATPVLLDRVAALIAPTRKLSEGSAAWVGGMVTGALGGLAADIGSAGLTLGGGMLTGALLGALGAAGLARGLNVVRGVDHSSVGLAPEAALGLAQAALLRYLAVAHFGRGRGDWIEGEAPAHWADVVQAAVGSDTEAWRAWAASPDAARAQVLLTQAARRVLERPYPHAWQAGAAAALTCAAAGS